MQITAVAIILLLIFCFVADAISKFVEYDKEYDNGYNAHERKRIKIMRK